MGYDADHPRARGEVGQGRRVDLDAGRLRACCSRDIPLDDVTTSMTINCTASVRAGHVPRPRRQAGRGVGHARRHHAERHAEGVHRPEGMDLSARAGGADRHRHDRVLRPSTCRASTRSRSPATTSARPARRRCRSWPSRWPTASATSRRRWQRGLDVDGFAPRLSFFFDIHNDFFEEIAKLRAARRIWARVHEGALRREEAGVDAAAHAHADRRRVGHRPAAAQQRGAGGAAGAGRGAGRGPVAAHQLLRRDAARCPPRKR